MAKLANNEEGLILGFLDENMTVWYLPLNAVEGKILSGWVMAGTSCVLIKRCVFAGGYRFKFDPCVTPDILFMFRVQRMGFVAKIYGDVLCGHLPEFPLAEAGVDAGYLNCIRLFWVAGAKHALFRSVCPFNSL